MATIKLNAQTGEIELSGSEEFVKSHIYLLEPHLNVLEKQNKNSPPVNSKSQTIKNTRSGNVKSLKNTDPISIKKPAASSFKKYIKNLPDSTRPGDYLLVAAHFISSSSADGYFGTRETSALLKDVGIDILNPSQYVKNCLNSGRIEAKDNRRFNILDKGFSHLNKVLNR